MKKWVVESSRYIVDDRWLKLRADRCRTADNSIVDPYYVTESRDIVHILAITSQNEAVMVHQYRHAAGEFVEELIAGMIDPGETPEAAARRELAEEAGYTGGITIAVGQSYDNPAKLTDQIHSFIVVGGDITQPPHHEASETLTTRLVSLAEIYNTLTAPQPLHQALHMTTLWFAYRAIMAATEGPLVALQPDLRSFK